LDVRAVTLNSFGFQGLFGFCFDGNEGYFKDFTVAVYVYYIDYHYSCLLNMNVMLLFL